MNRIINVLSLALLALGCSSKSASVPEKAGAPTATAVSITNDALGRYDSQWSESVASATPDAEGIDRLVAAPQGARVEIYLGTWCSDSRREVGRFLRGTVGADLPFEVKMYTLPSDKSVWPEHPPQLLYVPTFIVMREGKEVGRIVESSPGGVEHDLSALLEGGRSGVITGRTDLPR